MDLANNRLPILLIISVVVTASSAIYANESTILGRLQSRIYGGQNAAEGQFPYQVLVTRAGDGYIVVCGGAIISRNYVLTAAHCVNGYSPSDYSIRAGTVKYNSGGVVIKVAEVKIHPQYSAYNYDIALLRLSSPLSFNDKIKPVLLGSTDLPEGIPTIITGWGGVSSGGLANQLQYNTEYTLNRDSCIKRLNTIADSMRCLGKSAGNGVCGGDSGGPAVANGVLIGITAFIVNGCDSSLPNGFTDVVYSRDWIRANSDTDCSCSA
ncbi:chymotrypsin-2-like isoform X3 [Bactrocera dorsalis]|uniref:Chymotrypsin-2-like isoform X3 n=1 Tax=Bactrocera dorsalis TaxID=27457 RepID=A0A6J0RHR2_BACDO|nr:chymotrypsin-2-like isoform X3 [Bactrocera dorsalis]